MTASIGSKTQLNIISGTFKITKITDSEKNSLSNIVFPANMLLTDSTGALYMTDGTTSVSKLKPIPSLYDKNGNEITATYLTKQIASSTYQAKESGKGLSEVNFTKAMATKLEGISEKANAYTLPAATNTTIGGVSIPSTEKHLKVDATGALTVDVSDKLDTTANAASATKLATARTISISGDATGSTTFDGSANRTISVTLADSGATAGTYGSNTSTAPGYGGKIVIPTFTTDAKGRITSVSETTITLPPAQSIPSSITGNAGTATKLQTARTIAISGAVTGTATSFDGSQNISIEATSVDGSKVSGTVPQASKDGQGNTISTTYAKKNDVYTKTEVDGKISGIYHYKGTVASKDKLPTSGVVTGDVYNVGGDLSGKNYAAIVDDKGNISWDDIGGTVNLSNYYTKTEANNTFLGKSATAATATKLATSRNISITGAVTGTATAFDGTRDISINTTAVDGSKVTGTVSNAGKLAYEAGTANKARTVPFQEATIDPSTGNFKANYDTDFTYNPVTKELSVGTVKSINVIKNASISGKTITLTKGDGSTSTINLPADPTSVTGNAGTATKLATQRTIALGTGASGSVKFDGSSDVTIPVTNIRESYLAWGGKNFSGSYGVIDGALVDVLGANRFAFGDPSGVTIEYSRDGGTTWTDYGASDSTKAALFSTNSTIVIGKGESKTVTKDYQVRIIIDTLKFKCYSVLNKFIINISSNGASGCWCSLDIATHKNTTTFTNVVNKQEIAGWSGYNVINTYNITTYGNFDSQYQFLRFTFGCTGVSTEYGNTMSVNSIRAFGGFGWVTASNMAKHGHLYSYDYQQNATFPAQVTATQFNGLATKATADADGNTIAATYLKKADQFTKATADTLYLGKTATASAANKLATARSISLSGDVTGTATFDGSANSTITATLADSGVTKGAYGPTDNSTPGYGGTITVPQVTVDSKGRITSIASRTITLPSAQTIPSSITGNAGTATKLQTARTISIAGAGTGSTTFDGSANATITLTLADSGVTADSYGPATAVSAAHGGSFTVPQVTVDAKGIVTAITDRKITLPAAQTTITGNAGSATKLATARTISISGDASGSTAFDGSANKDIAITLADSGATAGSYGPTTAATVNHGGTISVPQITVDAKGRVTSAVSRTITMPAAQTSVTGNAGTATKLAMARTIAISGAVTGTATSFDGSSNISISATAVDGSKVTGTVPQASKDGQGNTISTTYAKKTDVYTKTEVNGLVAGAYHYKGTVATEADLPTTDVVSGDVYNIGSDLSGKNVAAIVDADGNISWDSLSGTVDLSAYLTKTQSDNAYLGKTATAAAATKLATARTISLSGDVTGSASFNGTTNATISATLADSGAKAGSYGPAENTSVSHAGTISVPQVTVDAKGRVTGIAARTITFPTVQTSVSGNAGTATKLATARTISISGDATGSTTFDGSANRTISVTLADSGATAGTYGESATKTAGFGGTIAVPKVVVDAKGRVTGISTSTVTLPAAPTSVSGNAGSATKLATARTISLSGDASGSVTFDGSANKDIAVTLADSGVTAGTFGPTAAATLGFGGSVNVPKVIVDTKGRVTGIAHYAIKLPAAPTTVTGNAGSATKLATARYINGVSFNGTADIVNYGTCSTAAATIAKVVSCTGFALKTGARISVKFTVTNTVTPTANAPITLNVNGTGAKSIFYHGAATFSAGYLGANRVVDFVYDGTNYCVVGDWDTNDRYGNMTAATASAAGKAGLVPAPAAGAQAKFLRGDGTWQTPAYPGAATASAAGIVTVGDNITVTSGKLSLTKANVTAALGYTPPTTNTQYKAAVYDTLGLTKPSISHSVAAKLTTAAATSTAAVTVNAVTSTANRYYAVEQDVNGVPFVNVPWANNTYSVFKAATASAAGGTGLVPAPAAGANTKYLRGDGTWQVLAVDAVTDTEVANMATAAWSPDDYVATQTKVWNDSGYTAWKNSFNKSGTAFY